MSAFQNCLVLMPKDEVASETWSPNGGKPAPSWETPPTLMVTARRAGGAVLLDVEVTDADGKTYRKQIVVLAAEGK